MDQILSSEITRRHTDGTYDIKFDDGERKSGVKKHNTSIKSLLCGRIKETTVWPMMGTSETTKLKLKSKDGQNFMQGKSRKSIVMEPMTFFLAMGIAKGIFFRVTNTVIRGKKANTQNIKMENIDQVIGLKQKYQGGQNIMLGKLLAFTPMTPTMSSSMMVKENQKFWRDKLDSKPQVLPGQIALQELVLERQALETSIRSTIEWKQN